jgi:hypothetical protein
MGCAPPSADAAGPAASIASDRIETGRAWQGALPEAWPGRLRQLRDARSGDRPPSAALPGSAGEAPQGMRLASLPADAAPIEPASAPVGAEGEAASHLAQPGTVGQAPAVGEAMRPWPTAVVTLTTDQRAQAPHAGLQGVIPILWGEGASQGSWLGLGPTGMPNPWLAAIAIAAFLLSATAVAARQHALHRAVGSRTAAGFGASAPDSASAAASCTTPEASAPPPPPPPPPGVSTRPPPRDDLEAATAEPSSTAPADAEPGTDPAALRELQTNAELLLALVRRIVTDHVPDGALREVLVTDLSVIDMRLREPALVAALAAGRLDLARPAYEQAILDLERARTLARIEHERGLAALHPSPRSPATLAEACRFLGINPRADAAVAKKVVDALRQNWHPDLAASEADRTEREERIKQINAAWDLVRRH